MAFAQMYECPTCGDVWKDVEMVEFIDCDRDDVHVEAMCSCGRSVEPKFVESNGERIPVVHALTDEEMESELWDAYDEWSPGCED